MAPNKETVFCSCTQGLDLLLPENGQRVRITLLKDVDSWEGNVRSVAPAGTVYEGTVANIDAEGFFDITTDEGQSKGFYVKDATIHVEVAVTEPSA